MTPQMPNACIPCAGKKRKCDRLLPKCSRCSRSKISQECLYRSTFDDHLLKFKTELLQSLPTADSIQRLPKSPVSCEKCREGKRACSRDLPHCARCERINASCHYQLAKGAEIKALSVDQDLERFLAQAGSRPPRRKTPHSKFGDNPSRPKDEAGSPDWQMDGPALSNFRRILVQQTKVSMQTLFGLQIKAQYPIPDRSDFAHLIHHYCETCFLPSTHRLQNSLTTHLHTVWMRRAMADPCLFHGTLFCASAHLDAAQGGSLSPRSLFHQSQALQSLRERLKENQISYETVGTALALTYYNMGTNNTESAIIHKRGLLRMLESSPDRGPDLESLTANVKLILLGLSMALDQQPPSIPFTGPSAENPTFTLQTDPRPSTLLQRAIERSAYSPRNILTSGIVSELQIIHDFITKAEHASTATVYTLHADAMKRRDINPTLLPPTENARKSAQIINQCCHLAIEIFWTVIQNALYPESVGVGVSSIDLSPALDTLRTIFPKLAAVDWQRHAPEVLFWVCFTAAGACARPADRIPFITGSTPVLSACDSTELSLTGESWGYFRWLVGFTEALWLDYPVLPVEGDVL